MKKDTKPKTQKRTPETGADQTVENKEDTQSPKQVCHWREAAKRLREEQKSGWGYNINYLRDPHYNQYGYLPEGVQRDY